MRIVSINDWSRLVSSYVTIFFIKTNIGYFYIDRDELKQYWIACEVNSRHIVFRLTGLVSTNLFTLNVVSVYEEHF